MAEEAEGRKPKRQKRCEAHPPTGVGFRSNSGPLYFETRFNCGGAEFRLYKSRIESVTVGGLMYDISKRYERWLKSVDGVGNEESPTLELNFSEYSLALKLDPFPSDLLELNDSNLPFKKKMDYKKKLVEMVRRQAHDAARNYPPSQVTGLKTHLSCSFVENQGLRLCRSHVASVKLEFASQIVAGC